MSKGSDQVWRFWERVEVDEVPELLAELANKGLRDEDADRFARKLHELDPSLASDVYDAFGQLFEHRRE